MAVCFLPHEPARAEVLERRLVAQPPTRVFPGARELIGALLCLDQLTLGVLTGNYAESVATLTSDENQWIHVAATYDGSGNGLGFVGMTTKCRADFGPGARMCTSSEIMDSDTLNPKKSAPAALPATSLAS